MQTKLRKDEKADVREMITAFENFGGMLFHFPEQRVTVAIAREFPGARMVKVAVAVASPTETKFRKLIGAMLAIERIDFGMAAYCADGSEQELAEGLAYAVGYPGESLAPAKTWPYTTVGCNYPY